MSAQVQAVTLNSVTDQVINMSADSWARPLALPIGWNKVRVGARLRATDLGGLASSTPRFAIGLCHGTTNLIGDATCDHFAGVVTNSITWQRTTSAGIDMYGLSGAIIAAPCTKIGSTLTIGSSIFTDGIMSIDLIAGTAWCRKFWFVDITKGSPNYTFNLFTMHNAADTADMSAAAFLSQMVAVTPVATGHSYGTNQTLAVDEVANGALNAMSVWWNRADFNIQLCDVGVAVIS